MNSGQALPECPRGEIDAGGGDVQIIMPSGGFTIASRSGEHAGSVEAAGTAGESTPIGILKVP